MSNYRDSFVKPEYIKYFNTFNLYEIIRNPVKLDYSKKYKKSIHDFDINIILSIKNKNIRYIWNTYGDVQDDLLHPLLNKYLTQHIKKSLEYLKKNNIKVYLYNFSDTYVIGQIVGSNGRNIRYLENRIAQLCKCRSIPRIHIEPSNNTIYIHFRDQSDFDKSKLDDIIDEYLLDFT